MPVPFTCPNCREEVSVADALAGLQGRCPACGVMVPIPAVEHGGGWVQEGRPQPGRARDPHYAPARPHENPPHPPRYQDRFGDEPPRDWRPAGAIAPGWSTVYTGLGLIRAGIVTFILAVLVMVLMAVVIGAIQAGPGRMRQDEAAIGIVGLLGLLGMLVGIILSFVGLCMCCAAPEESHIKGLAIGSLILLVASVILSVILIAVLIRTAGNILALRNPPMEAVAIVGVISLLIMGTSFTSQILFILFMRGIGRYFGNYGLVQNATAFLIVYCIVSGIALVGQILLGAAGEVRDPGLGILILFFGGLLVVGGITVLVWFLILLVRGRETIARTGWRY